MRNIHVDTTLCQHMSPKYFDKSPLKELKIYKCKGDLKTCDDMAWLKKKYKGDAFLTRDIGLLSNRGKMRNS